MLRHRALKAFTNNNKMTVFEDLLWNMRVLFIYLWFILRRTIEWLMIQMSIEFEGNARVVI